MHNNMHAYTYRQAMAAKHANPDLNLISKKTYTPVANRPHHITNHNYYFTYINYTYLSYDYNQPHC